jgi:putative protease
MKKKKAGAKARSKTVKKAKSRKPVKAKAKTKVKKSSSRKSPAKARAKKKAPAPGAVPRPGVIPPANGVLLGYVEDYFAKIGVIALTLKLPLAVGQRIQVLGHTTNLEQAIDSMQIDHAAVMQAAAKSAVGIKVIGRARRGDHVYLLK